MDYQNPKIPEGINTSREHPFKDFILLLLGVSALLFAALMVVSWALRFVGPLVPFSWERALSDQFAEQFIEQFETNKYPEKQAWLQQITDRLAMHEDLPEGMTITVHYSDSETVNALATIGGHIVVFQGLIDSVDSENALAMVIAHEIAHVKHRHPIVALGRALGTTAVFSLLGAGGDNVATSLLSKFGLLAMMSFNREQESQADQTGLAAIYQHYGHINGATQFFEKISEQGAEKDSRFAEFFATHPNSRKRIDDIRNTANHLGWSEIGDTEVLKAP